MDYLSLWVRTIALSMFLSSTAVLADTRIELTYSALATYYVDVRVGGSESDPYLLDTGASYMTITESTLERLQSNGGARYTHDLEGVMADGRSQKVPVYVVDSITIGDSCHLEAVEVAVIEGATRGLLGLSALRKASPFNLEFDTATMSLGGCEERP